MDVSGRRRSMAMSTGHAAQKISQSDQRQPLAMTAKPESNGPSAGPQYALLISVSTCDQDT